MYLVSEGLKVPQAFRGLGFKGLGMKGVGFGGLGMRVKG